jgi:glycosyltransferase involved in cell wall biosynthesis
MTFAMGDAVIESAFERFAGRRFDHVIAISEFMLNAVRAAGVREDRTTLAFLGVDAPKLRASVRTPRATKRAELEIADTDVAVVMVGNIRSWKGQHVLLEAMALLPPDVLAMVQVRFVGAESAADLAYRESLDGRIASMGIGYRIRFLGSRDDVPELYAAADIAIHASVIPEPFGLVVPEAMVHGIPVIASRFGGPGEVLTPECGRTFDPAHPEELARHLTELVRNASLRRSLGNEARRHVEAFSVREMVQRIQAAYDTVLGLP